VLYQRGNICLPWPGAVSVVALGVDNKGLGLKGAGDGTGLGTPVEVALKAPRAVRSSVFNFGLDENIRPIRQE